jgi:hypothetical protein
VLRDDPAGKLGERGQCRGRVRFGCVGIQGQGAFNIARPAVWAGMVATEAPANSTIAQSRAALLEALPQNRRAMR